MRRGCCPTTSRFLNNEVNGCAPGNVRYQYIDVPPLASGLTFSLANLGSTNPIVWYSTDVTLTIQKKGCKTSCDDALVYEADTIDMDNYLVTFLFDEKFYELCRGRYEGIITIGCNELSCRLDFKRGQRLCVSDVEVQALPDIDATAYPDPDCCDDVCPDEPNTECVDFRKRHSICGDSVPCAPEEIKIDWQISDKELTGIQEWMAGRESCADGDTDAQGRCLYDGTEPCESMDLTCEHIEIIKQGGV